jgi:hypothetical protein
VLHVLSYTSGTLGWTIRGDNFFSLVVLLSRRVGACLSETIFTHDIAIDDELYCKLDGLAGEAAVNHRTSRRIVDAADGSAFEGFLAEQRQRRTIVTANMDVTWSWTTTSESTAIRQAVASRLIALDFISRGRL